MKNSGPPLPATLLSLKSRMKNEVHMKSSFFVSTILVLACAVPAPAVPRSLFSDVDTYLEHAQEIVIAKCASIPEEELLTFDDGLYPATVEVVTTLKGDRKPGRLTVATIYPMTPGQTYLLATSGGKAFETDFLALGELSVVPIPRGFDLDRLKGKKTKQQVQLIFARHLYEVERQLAPLLHAQGLLQKALEDRRDDIFESRGNVRIGEIRETTTRAGSIIHLEFQAGRMEWSHSMPGKAGYLYFTTHGADAPEWEFAASDERDLNAFNGKPLKAKFYGSFSPSRDKRLGQQAGNAIQVEVGQIILARTVDDPKTLYLLKIERQEQKEAMTARYSVISGE
jgi:hypothetical protein